MFDADKVRVLLNQCTKEELERIKEHIELLKTAQDAGLYDPEKLKK